MKPAPALGEVLAVITSEEAAHQAFRARAEQLNYTRRSISLAAGLEESHAERILSPTPMKRIGPKSRYDLAGALEMEWVLRTAKKLNNKAVKRRSKQSSQAVRMARMVSKRFMRKIARAGGLARMAGMTKRQRSAFNRRAAKIQAAKMTPAQRSERARAMNRKRWIKPKIAEVNGGLR